MNGEGKHHGRVAIITDSSSGMGRNDSTSTGSRRDCRQPDHTQESSHLQSDLKRNQHIQPHEVNTHTAAERAYSVNVITDEVIPQEYAISGTTDFLLLASVVSEISTSTFNFFQSQPSCLYPTRKNKLLQATKMISNSHPIQSRNYWSRWNEFQSDRIGNTQGQCRTLSSNL